MNVHCITIKQKKSRRKEMIITATPFEVELIKDITKQTARTELLAELLTAIHDIYTQHLFCKEDLCMKEEVGYECEDCLYQSIQALIWQKKFEAEVNNNNTKENENAN